MAHTDKSSPTSLGEHLRIARRRAFVGRAHELALFRSALGRGADSFTVLFLTGPGGIGKSTLLRRFADEAAAAGRTVVEIDARSGEPCPAAFEADAAQVFTDDRAVLLVDTFEEYRPLEGWLRDHFLPRLPAGAVVVFAGRQPPEDSWRAAPGWDEVLQVVSLPELCPDDAGTMLAARGVPPEEQPAVLAFAGGNPLALCLAAELAGPRDFDGTGAWAPTQDVIGTLVSRLVGEVPSRLHGQALEICAHVHMTTEELLRATLPQADAGTLFAWLRGLPFMETGPFGVFPHDVVREVLDADLRWRDPQRYEAMHQGIHAHLIERIREARAAPDPVSGPAARSLSAAVLYLQRDGFGSDGNGSNRPHEVYEDTLRSGDRDVVLELAAEDGPEESVALVRHWLDRQPESFSVYRHAVSGEPLGFMSWLRLAAPRASDTEADPVVAAAWAHQRRTAPLRAGEHLAVARFTVRRAPDPSPTADLMSARIMSEVFTSVGLAWSFVVIEDFATFQQSSSATRLVALPPVGVGDRRYGLFGSDRRVMPPESFLEQMALAQFPNAGGAERTERGPAAPAPAPPAPAALARPEFDAAVRKALRSWHRPDALSASPLVRSGAVAADGRATPVEALQKALTEAVDRLRDDPQGEKPHRAVIMTFFADAPTQEAAAERLGLPYGTYRRHLARGIARVCELLWHREPPGERGGSG
ncbi:AAA family ATPase [Streptomyces sp. NPDC048650]|uniref:AAA family ATPase n=1 Tax=unclassified Streptomyces TaxID=2593676 RepID=UPI0037126D8B